MYYFIADIHGYFKKLYELYSVLHKYIREDDTLIFLGDYIDRGGQSYEVIDFLIQLSAKHNTVFLKGNHEGMLENYIRGKDQHGIYLINGGDATIRSYMMHIGEFAIPDHHAEFYKKLRLFFENDDFIAVHAGLNPTADSLEAQDEHDLLWIREKFYRANKRFEKTVIFGHTPTAYINGSSALYEDAERNIIGMDSGVIYGRNLFSLRWPDRKVFYGGKKHEL